MGSRLEFQCEMEEQFIGLWAQAQAADRSGRYRNRGDAMGIQDGQPGLDGRSIANAMALPSKPERSCDICGEPATGSGGMAMPSLLTCDACDLVVERQLKADAIEQALDQYHGLRDRHAMKGRAK